MNFLIITYPILSIKFVYAFKTLGASNLSDHKYEPLSNNSKETVIHVVSPFGLMCPDFSIKCLIKRHHFLLTLAKRDVSVEASHSTSTKNLIITKK